MGSIANVGDVERVIRAVAGLLLIGLAATGAIGPWGYIGAIPLATALVGFCPVYRVLGVSTCAKANP